MVVDKILKQITSEGAKKEIEAIQKIKLPPELQRWVEKYKKMGVKDDFFWRWSLWAIQKTSFFPLFKKEYIKSLEKTRFLLNMYVNLIDEVSEKRGGHRLLDELLKIPFIDKKSPQSISYLTKKEKKFFDFTKKTWQSAAKEIKKYPGYKYLEDFFIFNILQVVSSLKYDYIINKNNNLINISGNYLYSPHSTQVITTFILNSMCSKQKIKDFNLLMNIAYEAQRMVRIGNWIGTWKKEILERDFSSAVFSYAIDKEIIDLEDLSTENMECFSKKIIKSNVESYLLKDWLTSYNKLINIFQKFKLVNLKKFIRILEEFLAVDLFIKELKNRKG